MEKKIPETARVCVGAFILAAIPKARAARRTDQRAEWTPTQRYSCLNWLYLPTQCVFFFVVGVVENACALGSKRVHVRWLL